MNQKQYEKLQIAKDLLEEKYQDRKYWDERIKGTKNIVNLKAIEANKIDTEIEIEALEGYIATGESVLDDDIEGSREER